MRPHLKLAIITGALALSVAPALAAAGALGSVPPGNQGISHGHGKGHGPIYAPSSPTPGPGAGLPAKANAYGRYCQGESKKHGAGEKGTPFSQCVTAMAKAANNSALSPGQACKGMSKRHVKGEKGTPFSRCVSGAAKLRKSGVTPSGG
jgi:hypothetical protein